MHIAIDCRAALDPLGGGEMAGVGHYVQGIVKSLIRSESLHRFTLFFSKADQVRRLQQEWEFGSEVFVCIAAPRQVSFWSAHIQFARQIEAIHPDLFFAPHGQLPLGYKGRSMISAHDFAIYRHP